MFSPDSLFSMYANRQQNIEDFINLLSADADAGDPATQAFLANQCGLSLDSLTSDEIDYIESAVNNR